MKVSEIMSAGVQTVRPGTPLATARERMRGKKIHHLLVMEDAEIRGVLSLRDLTPRGRIGGAAKLTVAEAMTPRVVTVAPETSVRRAANTMRGHAIGCVIVVEAGVPVGIVTLSDLLERVAAVPRRHRLDKHTPPDLNFRVPHNKQHRSGLAW
jgi:acetoin utilization protein AcuB